MIAGWRVGNGGRWVRGVSTLIHSFSVTSLVGGPPVYPFTQLLADGPAGDGGGVHPYILHARRRHLDLPFPRYTTVYSDRQAGRQHLSVDLAQPPRRPLFGAFGLARVEQRKIREAA